MHGRHGLPPSRKSEYPAGFEIPANSIKDRVEKKLKNYVFLQGQEQLFRLQGNKLEHESEAEYLKRINDLVSDNKREQDAYKEVNIGFLC